jgi:hypothetical protein
MLWISRIVVPAVYDKMVERIVSSSKKVKMGSAMVRMLIVG